MTTSESRFFHISKTGKLDTIPSLTSALAATSNSGYIWLDYCQPSKEELFTLIQPLGLHPLSIEDCTHENQLPKMDDFRSHTFMIFNAYEYTTEALIVNEVDVFIGTNFLITVSGRDSKNQPILKGIEKLVELESDLVQHGPAFLLHIIMDKIVDQKFLAIETIEEELDQEEEVILTDLAKFDPSTLLHLRKDLLAIRKNLFHEREILGKIARKDSPFIPEKAIYFYRDIHDHLSKFYELTESSRDLVTILMEMYLSMLNNQMSKAANQTNAIVRRLTLITTIFMPLTLIS
ncbi:MAG: magnesium transporter CorA family protein, partial [Chloroflexota bacterium]